MASLTTAEPSTLSAKEYAAQQTRRRRSLSGGSTGSAPIGRIVATTTKSPVEPIKKSSIVVPFVTGMFSGTGGAVGVYIRVELVFQPGSTVHCWVWSSATESFDIPNIGYMVGADNGITFGPALMKGMEGRVVTGIKATWNPDKDTVHLCITIKVGRWVPSVNITTTCIGVKSIVGSVKAVPGKGEKRERPY